MQVGILYILQVPDIVAGRIFLQLLILFVTWILGGIRAKFALDDRTVLGNDRRFELAKNKRLICGCHGLRAIEIEHDDLIFLFRDAQLISRNAAVHKLRQCITVYIDRCIVRIAGRHELELVSFELHR